MHKLMRMEYVPVSVHQKTDIEVSDYTNLGNKYVDGVWEEVPDEPIPAQPTNAEIAQLVSDLQADLLIAGVI